jgi:hypothetical protein
MAIAGFFMLLFLSWVPAALLIAAAYAARNETLILQKEPINLQSG